ncbi:MAG: hypothetical protein JXR51_06090 [Bacteroidales bacterium]|nr:hypothetical protein [Bacteroidales bacterium]MBN2756731.1 hypothetical protein [Bacteroidales bacterium]
MKTKLLFFTLITFLLGLNSCNTSYNTDFAPPAENPKFSDVYPEKINGLTNEVVGIEVDMLGVEGNNAIYGNSNIVISAYQISTKEVADDFFKKEIVPVFETMPVRSSGNINGKWYASGKDGDKKAYGWVNSNWVFLITADNEENFNAAIEAFKFITAK